MNREQDNPIGIKSSLQVYHCFLYLLGEIPVIF